MRDLVKTGMAAAEAARTVLSATAIAPPHDERHDTDPFTVAADRIVDAVVRFDPEAIQKEVSRSFVLGSAVAIFDGALAPALRRIGDLWHAGEITVAQEHLATNIIGAMLLDLLRLVQPTDNSRRVVLACFAEEDHALGLVGVGIRFATWGFTTLLLGTRTPPSAIARTVEVVEPDVVALSASISLPASRARELIDEYSDACRGTVWVVGGSASSAMRPWVEHRGGMIAPDDPGEFRRAIEAAVRAHRRPRGGSLEIEAS